MRYIIQTHGYDDIGFIVSNEFYEEKEKVFLLENVNKDNSIIIVTPDDYDV